MHAIASVTACQFAPDGESWCCHVCGRRTPKRGDKPPMAACRRGLGDMVADGLAAAGITKERVQRIASAVGIEDCGCQERQAALNELGRRLGIGIAQTTQPDTEIRVDES